MGAQVYGSTGESGIFFTKGAWLFYELCSPRIDLTIDGCEVSPGVFEPNRIPNRAIKYADNVTPEKYIDFLLSDLSIGFADIGEDGFIEVRLYIQKMAITDDECRISY